MATTRIITLNEIIKLFKDFSKGEGSNAFVRDFGYGPTSEIGVSRQMEFPYIWLGHQSDSYIRVANKNMVPELKLVVLAMDQVNIQSNFEETNGENSDNGQEIMSDMLQVIEDLTSEILTNWGQYGISMTEDVRFLPAFDETPDSVNGWAAEFTLRLTHFNCTTPLS